MCIRLHGLDRVRTVFGPFSGSGSTALAAAELGVTGVGIEIDAGYAAHSAKREPRTLLDGGTSGPGSTKRRAR
jgi:site-specific DNA-methyltransferase (adenine-specific)